MFTCGVPLGGGQRLQSSLTGNKAVKIDKNKNKKKCLLEKLQVHYWIFETSPSGGYLVFDITSSFLLMTTISIPL